MKKYKEKEVKKTVRGEERGEEKKKKKKKRRITITTLTPPLHFSIFSKFSPNYKNKKIKKLNCIEITKMPLGQAQGALFLVEKKELL